MSILYLLIPLSLALVAFAAWACYWAVDTEQFDDLESPGWEIFCDDTISSHPPKANDD